jgi:flagellin FlaB
MLLLLGDLFVWAVTHRVLYRNSQYSWLQVKRKMKIKQSLRKLLKQNRAMVGIEAAIVLIAFVIVAAAFAFMVVNMGLYATQSGKTTIQTGISEAGSPLVVDGDIMIHANTTAPYYVDAMMIPLQVVGVRYVPMDVNSTEVTLTVSASTTNTNNPGGTAIANCYHGVVPDNGTNNPYNNTLDTLVSIVNGSGLTTPAPQSATLSELFIGNGVNNTSLESNEKGYLVFWFAPGDRAVHGQTIYAEIRPEQGAPISISFVVSAQLSTGWSEVGT